MTATTATIGEGFESDGSQDVLREDPQNSEKKHSLAQLRPFKCLIEDCSNVKGFATLKHLRRHQEDIHLIEPEHDIHLIEPEHEPLSYYRCVLRPCATSDKIWTRKDKFKAHINRLHRNIAIDVDHLIVRSTHWTIYHTAMELEELARDRAAKPGSRAPKVKFRSSASDHKIKPPIEAPKADSSSTESRSTDKEEYLTGITTASEMEKKMSGDSDTF